MGVKLYPYQQDYAGQPTTGFGAPMAPAFGPSNAMQAPKPTESPGGNFLTGIAKALTNVAKAMGDRMSTPQGQKLLGQLAQAVTAPGSVQSQVGAIGQQMGEQRMFGDYLSNLESDIAAPPPPGMDMDTASRAQDIALARRNAVLAEDTMSLREQELGLRERGIEVDEQMAKLKGLEVFGKMTAASPFKPPSVQKVTKGKQELTGYFVPDATGEPKFIEMGRGPRWKDDVDPTGSMTEGQIASSQRQWYQTAIRESKLLTGDWIEGAGGQLIYRGTNPTQSEQDFQRLMSETIDKYVNTIGVLPKSYLDLFKTTGKKAIKGYQKK